jgi:DnaD/phage-associated family protein
MARPNKQGVDYFPLDVHMDDKIKFVEIKFKLEGFAIVVKLMQRIYANGFWCRWSEDELLLFSDEIKADPLVVDGVAIECIKRGVFDGDLFNKYGILTSKGIQKRYKEIVRRRKDVEVIEEYLLIDNNFGINDVINPSESKRNDGKSTQSKVKESKLNRNEKEITTTVVNPFDFYQQNFGVLNSFMAQDIEQWEKDLNSDMVVEAMKISLQQNKNWKYATGILRDWHKNNLKSLEDVQAYNLKYEGRKQVRTGGVKNGGKDSDAEVWREENGIPF